MSKTKTSFFCRNCGHQAPKWMGKCPSCNEWNSFVEEVIEKSDNISSLWRKSIRNNALKNPQSKSILLEEIKYQDQKRVDTADEEFNRVLGGGITPGSITLIGGEPGIGKSTLMLQLALGLRQNKVLYVSGEESAHQIKSRADRLNVYFDYEKQNSENHGALFILPETSTDEIFSHISDREPEIVIVDSIQTLHSPRIEAAPGSVSQIRECTAELLRFAKETSIPVLLIGHITKDGVIAGPKVLEHMVDTVIQFEGEQHYTYRILRTIKNRFGPSFEMGVYQMTGLGLRPVAEVSELLLSHTGLNLSGVSISVTVEGTRPMLVETQALVGASSYGTAQRSSTGLDSRRMNMLIAVLEKRCGYRYGSKDVFLNIAGGVRSYDTAIDLGLATSIVSSDGDIPIPPKTCFAAEIGLSGEIRAVSNIERRLSESEKMGFEKIFISKYTTENIKASKFNIEIVSAAKLEEVCSILF